jgi:hypothetical protein
MHVINRPIGPFCPDAHPVSSAIEKALIEHTNRFNHGFCSNNPHLEIQSTVGSFDRLYPPILTYVMAFQLYPAHHQIDNIGSHTVDRLT